MISDKQIGSRVVRIRDRILRVGRRVRVGVGTQMTVRQLLLLLLLLLLHQFEIRVFHHRHVRLA